MGSRTRAVFTLCIAALSLSACETSARGRDAGTVPPKPVITDVTHKDYVGPKMPKAKVILQDAFGGQQVVDVEVAATGDQRQRGLMWRTKLDEGTGMLFIFPTEDVQSFWMRNTLIALDMIFINEAGTVVGIVENAEPQTLVSRSVGIPGKYVLEVPGGWSAKVGIKAGAKAELKGTQMLKVEW